MSTSDEQMVVAHFIVSDDVERSRRFYTDVLGGKTVISGEAKDEVTYIALANSWIIINVGGGPTDDKPTVTLETQPNPDRVSSFLNIRVADIQAVYAEWSARGAQFLTPPKQHETEIRCYVRDPDGYLIEVGQRRWPEVGVRRLDHPRGRGGWGWPSRDHVTSTRGRELLWPARVI
jgi:catechol 2,3-dioxygenase-like lactoylglutathione lyase family enzyme